MATDDDDDVYDADDYDDDERDDSIQPLGEGKGGVECVELPKLIDLLKKVGLCRSVFTQGGRLFVLVPREGMIFLTGRLQ